MICIIILMILCVGMFFAEREIYPVREVEVRRRFHLMDIALDVAVTPSPHSQDWLPPPREIARLFGKASVLPFQRSKTY